MSQVSEPDLAVQTVSDSPSGSVSARRKNRIRNPLSPSTFLVRNLGKTLPLVGVIILAVMLVMCIISLVDSIPLSIRTIYGYSKEDLGLSPRGEIGSLGKLLDIIKKESPVPTERVIICRASSSEVKSIVGKWPFIMLGLHQEDMHYYLNRQRVKSIEGRMPASGAPEALVSDPVATNLGLKIGSIVQGPDLENSYSPFPVKVVGIAHTDRWLMVNSFEYQAANHFPPLDFGMVFAPTPGQQSVLDHWAYTRFKGMRAQTFAYFLVERNTQEMFKTLFALLNAVIGLLVLVITIMMAMLINIYQNQRLVEYGLLQAIGFTKSQLLRRTVAENVIVITLGWILGIFLAVGTLTVLKSILMTPHAFALDPVEPQALKYTVPIPLTILVVAIYSIWARFKNFDPVAVVERRIV